MTGADLATWVDPVFWRVTLGGALRLATPIAFAALGEAIAERSGTLNLGVDGMMSAGALAAVVGASLGGWPFGLFAAALVGLALGVMMAAATLAMRINQIIAGIAFSLISTGLTAYLFQIWQPSGGLAPFAPLAPTLRIPGLADIPFLGDVLFRQSALVYGCAAMVGATMFALRYTRIGLALTAAGDDPASAALRGVEVAPVRLAALAFAGGMAGLGGAAITIGFLGSYSDGVTAGRGYVAIAVVIIGRWTPLGATLGALLFALFDSLGLRLQGRWGAWPNELFSIAPYAMTLLFLVLSARSHVAPRTLGADLDVHER